MRLLLFLSEYKLISLFLLTPLCHRLFSLLSLSLLCLFFSYSPSLCLFLSTFLLLSPSLSFCLPSLFSFLLHFSEHIRPVSLSLKFELLLTSNLLFLLTCFSFVPLISLDTLVFIIYLEELQVLSNLIIIEFELYANFTNFFCFQDLYVLLTILNLSRYIFFLLLSESDLFFFIVFWLFGFIL